MTKKRILITGGAGFIGFHIAQKLAMDNDNEIIMLDNLSRGRLDDDFSELLRHNNITFINADITNPLALMRLDHNFNYIYHLAAVIGVRNVTQNPDRVLYVNALSIIYLFEFARNNPNLKKIFFSSTSEIYAGTVEHFSLTIPTPEDVPLTLLDIRSSRTTYMLSKMYGESVCFNYGRIYDIPFTIGRYHNVYGPRMGFQHVVPEMFIKISKNDVVDVPSPHHTRAMCYIDDAVEMTIRACESPKTKFEIFNIGNPDEEIEIIELVKVIAAVMKRNITINEQSDTAGSPSRRCPDIHKLESFIAYHPRILVKKGIEKTFSWYSHQLENRYE